MFQHKCEQYWPEQGSRQFGELRVETKETEHFANFMIRVFELQRVRTELGKLRKSQELLFALSFMHPNSVKFSMCSECLYCKITILYATPACNHFSANYTLVLEFGLDIFGIKERGNFGSSAMHHLLNTFPHE